MTAALDDAQVPGGWGGTWNPGFQDFFVERIGPDAQDATRFWGYTLNYRFPDVGGCQQRVAAGDEILFTYDSFNKPLMKLEGATRAEVGKPFGVTVTDGMTGAPLAGADDLRRLRHDRSGRAP